MLITVLGIAACRKKEATEFVVFDRSGGCVIAVPEGASAEELRAAELVQATLAKASGRGQEDFPIERLSAGEEEEAKRKGDFTVFLHGSNHRSAGEARLVETVRWRVLPRRVEIMSYPADAIEGAAAWFLQATVGARWFMPGALGEHIPVRSELRLALGEHTYRPSYISRNLGLGGGNPDQAWWRRNRLRSWFRHTHAMNDLFKPEALRENPELAPLVGGAKYFPSTSREENWQPNIAAPGAAEHAASVLAGRHEFSSAIGMNDSIRFDQSERTKERLDGARWFRLKPDYSRLVFGFVNEVAKRVPGRYLGAYAYDWTEDTPGFRIERNVVPYLTADRSEWFDPAFAEQDQALIKRWVAAGSEVVGLYDYYYGAPYLVPRPTLYAVTRVIPFAHEAGVRAFYAEVYPNWGLDGPKAWLAAELLWDASAKPAELLNIYYRDFWREAAGPMREFYALCDRQWLNQPKPSYWIKYYKDEHQALLFPSEVRVELKRCLNEAARAATTELTRQRVKFAADAFSVTDAFCAWEEAKDELSRLALPAKVDEAAIRVAWEKFEASGRRLKEVRARVTREAPLAVKAAVLPEYERNDPRGRAAWRLRARATEDGERRAEDGGRRADGGGLRAEGGPSRVSAFSFQPSAFPSRPSGVELLQDVDLTQLRIKPPAGSMDLEWVTAGPWRGHGEPYETRRVSVEQGAQGEAHSAESTQPDTLTARPLALGGETVLRFAGCKQETFSQLTSAEPGQWYVARVKVRGKVSPGNMTFLILNFQDAAGKALGFGTVDRLPVGVYGEGRADGGGRRAEGGRQTAEDGRQTAEGGGRRTDGGAVELVVWAQAPATAKWVGLGVRALNQVEEDYAAFSEFSLQALAQ